MKIKLYLDKRRKQGEPYPLKVSFSHKGDSALLPLGIYLNENQFNAEKERVENHGNKIVMNAFIKRRVLDIEEIILKLSAERKLAAMSATEIKNYVRECLDGTPQKKTLFIEVLNEYIDKTQNYHTKRTYILTLNKLTAFDKNLHKKGFEDINLNYIQDFERWLINNGMSQNTRAIMFKNFAAIFNYAIRQELINSTPFTKFSYKYEATAKRALTVEQLRKLFNLKTDGKKRVYQDIFKLSFCLIGINIVDLIELTEIVNGRVEYKRAKTGRHYSIKVEPEAAEIISRLKNSEKLVHECDGYKRYDYFMVGYNNGLKSLAAEAFSGTDNEKLIKKISHYWCRHTWATIAASLDIPRDTIAHALGHGKSTVTDIYIDFDLKKVDEANRKVIDYVFYNKK